MFWSRPTVRKARGIRRNFAAPSVVTRHGIGTYTTTDSHVIMAVNMGALTARSHPVRSSPLIQPAALGSMDQLRTVGADTVFGPCSW